MANVVSKIQINATISGTVNGSITGQSTDTGNNVNVTTNTFPAGSTNASMTMVFTLTNLQQVVIKADQPCTIKTNSSSTPQETITLVANKPEFYSRSGNGTISFAGNVTTAFVTCTPATTIQMEILQS